MSPLYKSLLAILASGFLLTFLLAGNQSSDPSASGTDISSEMAAQQITQQLNDNVKALSNGLNKLSNSSFWQNNAVTEWPLQISSQRDIYQAAGLNLLGVHIKSNNSFFVESTNQSSPGFELEKPLERLYQSRKSTLLIQSYKEQPAVILLIPIKTIENKMIGSLVGIKLLDKALLKNLHYVSKLPAALLKNGRIFQSSLEQAPDLNEYELVKVNWPENIQSSVWQIVLTEKKPSFFAGSILWFVIGLLVTFSCLFFVWQQLQKIQNTLKLLNQTLDLDLPIAEQIKRLTNIQNISNDLDLLDCSQAIRSRLEQLSQQKKVLAIEVRKLQEKSDVLVKDKNFVEKERDSAVAAPRLKSEFLSRMGDEITTPMKSVVSMLKLLSEYSFEPEPKQLLNIAKRSTRTLVNNLNNILDFSKLDAEMLRLKPKAFSVRELVDDLSSELSHFANEKDLSLQASSDPEMPALITADEYRIKQILRNLLGNAIRFTKSGEVTLYADLSAKSGSKLLRFTVADTGIGISPAAQLGLFDSLQQTTKLSNSSFAGRLRLIVSKKLAELMGGEIGVISEMGQGSQFWFTIAFKE